MKPARTSSRKAPSGSPEPAPDTRERILLVAREMIGKRGNAAISLVEVAQRAGVSRQTLYLLFGNRAGLLLAIVEHIDSRSGGPRALSGVRTSLPPRQAFEPYLRAWFDYLPVVFPLARALSAAATAGDTEASDAWESRMNLLRGGFLQLTKGLHAAGALQPGWTPATAADWMFGLTHVDMWQHLVVQGRWKPAEAIDRVIATLRTTLLAGE